MKNKVALITGVGLGIGKSIAHLFELYYVMKYDFFILKISNCCCR